jgi:hypothetical protein
MSLYISVNTPSAALAKSPIDEAITFYAASIAMEKRVGTFPEGPKLDITFMLSTQKNAPDFKGMRMGAYDDENQILYIETSVPEHISHSPVAQKYVRAVLQDAIDNAQYFFHEHGVEFKFDQWHKAIGQLAHSGSAKSGH